MPLTKEQENKIIKKIDEALEKKGKKEIICSICGNKEFILAGGVSNIFITDRFSGGIVLGGPVLPNVPIICKNCGNTFFMNAKVLGINFEEETSKEDNKKEKQKKEEKSNG